MKRAFVIAVLVLVVTASAGTLYKWVDQSGVYHFTDTPPPPGAARRIETLATPEPAQPVPKGGTTDWKRLDDEFRLRHQAREKDEDSRRFALRQQEELAELQKSAPFPGETIASVPLQRDVIAMLLVIDGVADRRCFKHQVVNTERVSERTEQRKWVEQWTLLRCGKRVRFRIEFSPAPTGGILFSIRTPGEELP